MKLRIHYPASVYHSQKKPFSLQKIGKEIEEMSDPDTKIADFFTKKISGLCISGGDVGFVFNTDKQMVYTLLTFRINPEPTTAQIDEIVNQANQQIDLGYYGEDGWFIDLSDGSYYLTLWDKTIGEPLVQLN